MRYYSDDIINKPQYKLAEFDHTNQTLQNNGLPKRSDQFLALQTEPDFRSQPPNTYSAFISIQYYVQKFFEAVERVLAQIDIRMALKPHCMLLSLFPKPKDRIVESEKVRFCMKFHVVIMLQYILAGLSMGMEFPRESHGKCLVR